jgi:pimeloyl-ACP methyl ester carboxylesterase
MKTAISKDGTVIAYEQVGEGRPLILVDGALCGRGFGPMPVLASLLARHFSVIYYDRRGRGDSSDTTPHAPEREIEDLKALVDVAGGSVGLYGCSSGAALALRAAGSGLRVNRLALYEPPFVVDDSRTPIPADYVEQLKALLAADRRGDMIKLFMRTVGVPAAFIVLMRLMPVWPKLKAVAHTLPYDFTIMRGAQSGKPLPAELTTLAGSIKVPVLVMCGGKSPEWMYNAGQATAAEIPGAAFRVLEGQTHNISAAAMAPALLEFFAG